MKFILPISILLAALAIFLPFITAANPEPAPLTLPEPTQTLTPSNPSDSDYPIAAADAPLDSAQTLTLKTGDTVLTLTLSDYLRGVVAAEMPANFNDEALKAQAVVARTYTYYSVNHRPAGQAHPDADVCDNPAHCQGWLSDDACREKWGDNYDTYSAKIAAAVAATDGLCAVYNGEPICAVFHSSSGGYTEDSVNVWSESLPYLTSVQSPESGTSVPDFVTSVSYSLNDLKRTALETYPDMTFPDAPENWLTNVSRSETERVISLKVGGITLTGTQFRLLFGLRSANASWSIADGVITFTVRGYGHGVGMSQYGANEFARNGAAFGDILRYFYKGIDITVIGKMA
ncbi:MAG: stage II sporulation protein D [Oscillospiraceae bacterium]|jgi:stage II sporulation protein D|nr:stage II sporulation protein D [Oscillospiraceae bacterium]